MNSCAHFSPQGSGINQAGYAMMDAYKDKCWWCEIERLRAALQKIHNQANENPDQVSECILLDRISTQLPHWLPRKGTES